jgi:uncharacterized protein (TIGR03000 family)
MCALFAAVLLVGVVDSVDGQFFRRGPYLVSPSYYAPGPINYYYSPMNYGYPYYNPYIAPYPAYGILPEPLATRAILGTGTYSGARRTADEYGYDRALIDTPRKRASAYPAVPYENTPPVDKLADLRRVKFIVHVPTEDAVVLFDGAETKQTGLTRTFRTPPMEEDRLFSSTIEAIWRNDADKKEERKETRKFVAGETITITFK